MKAVNFWALFIGLFRMIISKKEAWIKIENHPIEIIGLKKLFHFWLLEINKMPTKTWVLNQTEKKSLSMKTKSRN